MQQAELKGAVQELPAAAGINLANWNWRVVRQFVSERFGTVLSRSSCLNWLHRLGFAFKRRKKRLVKADEAKREAFVAVYADLREKAEGTDGKIFFADEAHFRADAELRGKWTLRGEPALVDSTSPRRGERVSYYSAVCLGYGRGGMDGTGGEQQCRNIGGLSVPVAPEARRTGDRDLGQRAGAPRGGDAGVPANSGAGTAVGESAWLQARTSMPMRRYGAGRGRRPPETCAWAAKP